MLDRRIAVDSLLGDIMRTNTAITIGVYCTLFFEILFFWLNHKLFPVNDPILILSLAPGWTPVVVIAFSSSNIKKIERVTWIDVVLMIFGFPLVFSAFVAISRFLL
jgi:hypothetical protein